MSAKHRCDRDGSQKRLYSVNSLTPANVGLSRAALLASASLIALAALGAPDAARAACNGTNTTISTSRLGRSPARAADHPQEQRNHQRWPDRRECFVLLYFGADEQGINIG